jgi:hypothetical protein
MGKIERIQVAPEDREWLVKLVKDRNTPQKIVWRSQIIGSVRREGTNARGRSTSRSAQRRRLGISRSKMKASTSDRGLLTVELIELY